MTIVQSKLNNHEQIKTVGGRTSSARNFYELEIEYQFSLVQKRDSSPTYSSGLAREIERSKERAKLLDDAYNSPGSTWASVEVFCKAWTKRFANHPAYKDWYRLFCFN